MCSCPEFFLLSGICHTGTDKFSFFSGRCPYHSRDKSQGLRRSPKGLTFTFGSVERAAAYPRHDREIRLFTSICRDSPAYLGQTISAFYFNLPGLSCIPGTDNYLYPPPYAQPNAVEGQHTLSSSPGLPGMVTTPLWDYILTSAFPALIQVRQTNSKEVQYYEQNEDSCNIC